VEGTAEDTTGLDWLKLSWGDAYEDIRRRPEDGLYQARCRSGDGEILTGATCIQLERELRIHFENRTS